jgi:hypothetical protein
VTSRYTPHGKNALNVLYGSRELERALGAIGHKVVAAAVNNLRAASNAEATAVADQRWLRYKSPTDGPGVNDAREPVNQYRRLVKSDPNPGVTKVEYRTGLVVSNHWSSLLWEVGTSRRPTTNFLKRAAGSVATGTGAQARLFPKPKPPKKRGP